MRTLGRLLRIAAWVDLAILVGAALFCWFTQRRTLYFYSEALTYGGFLAWIAGAFSVLGQWSGAGNIRSFEYQYSRTAGVEERPERSARDLRDQAQSYAFLISMLIAGAVAILLATVLRFLV